MSYVRQIQSLVNQRARLLSQHERLLSQHERLTKQIIAINEEISTYKTFSGANCNLHSDHDIKKKREEIGEKIENLKNPKKIAS
jgi:hypothetical protein